MCVDIEAVLRGIVSDVGGHHIIGACGGHLFNSLSTAGCPGELALEI